MTNTLNSIKKKPIVYFGLKLAVLSILLFIFDFSIGNVLSHYYFKQESGYPYRTTYSIEKTTSEILIFGSSRANHHYVPDIFEKRLNMSCYNAGRDGNFILYHSAVLKGVLKRYTPKIVILDFNGSEFMQDQQSYDRLSSLLPYYKGHPEMRHIIELKSKYEKLKLLSNIYPYNSLLLTIASGNMEFYKKRHNDIKGYVPLTKVWGDSIMQEDKGSHIKYDIDTVKINAYKAIIQDCKHSGTKLYIVCSPYFVRNTAEQDISIVLAKKIALENGVSFFDYSSDPMFADHLLFADFMHLNDTGANLFTNNIIERISPVREQGNTIIPNYAIER